jgi:Spy/CpxP family protein refolding chaperone
MKAIIRTAVIFSLLAIGISVFAHEGKGRANGKNIGKHIEKIKTELGLTEAQSAQIRSIIETSKAEMKADVEAMKNADTKDEKAAARAELKKDQQAMRERIMAVLTPEQRAKAENMRGIFKEKMKDKRGKKGGKHRGGVDDDGTSPAPSDGGTPKSAPQGGGTQKSSGGTQGKTKI